MGDQGGSEPQGCISVEGDWLHGHDQHRSSLSPVPPIGRDFFFWYTIAMSRFTKQLFYGGLFLAIIAAIGWGGYRLVVPAPNCTDGIQNNAEEGLDCGPVCGTSCPPIVLPLSAPTTQLIHYGNGTYDVLVTIGNPNAAYGAAQVDYTLVVSDVSGTQLMTRRGLTYVNPLEPRYMVFPLIGISGVPVTAELQFTPADVQWARLDVEGGLGVEFIVRQDQLVPALNSLRYQANLMNRSTFDFDQVDVTVLLYDQAGTVVGTGATVVRTVPAGQERGFVVDWPFAIPSAVRARAFVTTNVFNNDNYIRAHGSQERFQGF